MSLQGSIRKESPSRWLWLRQLPRPSRDQMKVFALGIAGLAMLSVIISEHQMPGYGYWSRIAHSPENVAAARQKLVDARAARAELAANQEFVQSITKTYTVVCPDAAKWDTLSAADQQRWHRYWSTEQTQYPAKLTLWAGSKTCYDP